eukprot:s1156_g28.t1
MVICTRTPVARPLEIRAPFRVHVRDVPVRIRPKENVAIDLPSAEGKVLCRGRKDSPMGSEPEVRERARTVREKIWGVADTPGVGSMPLLPQLLQLPIETNFMLLTERVDCLTNERRD